MVIRFIAVGDVASGASAVVVITAATYFTGGGDGDVMVINPTVKLS